MKTKRLPKIHPGEVLREEFMQPLGLSSYRLAKELHVTQPRVNDVVLEKRAAGASVRKFRPREHTKDGHAARD